MAQCPNGFRISSHLQEIIAYLGSDYVFEEGSELLGKLLDVDISAKQLQKVSEYLGSKLEEEALLQQKEKQKTTPTYDFPSLRPKKMAHACPGSYPRR